MFRAAAPLRSSAVRSAIQRRLASTESSGFTGAQNNAFNRERQAVKDHAAATSGELPEVNCGTWQLNLTFHY
jgi:cytochrome c oxidase subunit 6a